MDFQQASDKFKELKAQFESARLSEADFKSQLQDLMVRDEQGAWWMLGYETERWYRYDGANWVPADPPMGDTVEKPAALITPQPLGVWAFHEASPHPATASTTSPSPAEPVTHRDLKASAPQVSAARPTSQVGEQELQRRPRWRAAFLMSLVWLLEVLLARSTLETLPWFLLLAYLLPGLLLVGIWAPLATAWVLRSEHLLRRWQSLLYLTFIWLIATLIASLFLPYPTSLPFFWIWAYLGLPPLIAGALGAFLTARVLQSEGVNVGDRLAQIVLGSAGGWWLGSMVGRASGFGSVEGALLIGGVISSINLVAALRRSSLALPSSRP